MPAVIEREAGYCLHRIAVLSRAGLIFFKEKSFLSDKKPKDHQCQLATPSEHHD